MSSIKVGEKIDVTFLVSTLIMKLQPAASLSQRLETVGANAIILKHLWIRFISSCPSVCGFIYFCWFVSFFTLNIQCLCSELVIICLNDKNVFFLSVCM